MQVLSDARYTLRGSKLTRVIEPFLRSRATMIKFKLFKKKHKCNRINRIN